MKRIPLAAIASLGLVLSPAAPAETLYSVQTLDAPSFTPLALGGDGLFAGYESFGQFITHAALFDGEEVLDLGTLGGTYSQAHGVNASGRVVGESYTDDDDFIRAFVWDGETMDELPSLGGNASAAHAINAGGIVVGYSGIPVTQYGRALLWKDGALTELGTLGGNQSVALDINEAGQIVGWSWNESSRPRAFLWEGDLEATPPQGEMIDLGALEGGEAFANAINDVGQVVGRSLVTGTSNLQRAALWQDGEVINLGRLRDTDSGSEAKGINNAGQIVGRSGSTAFLWEEGTLHALNDRLAPDSSGWVIGDAFDINEAGWILGRGRLGAFNSDVLLVPVPEPEAQWLAGLTGLALAALARRRAPSTR
jgi:MYXO-CTERM domain-containing protein